MSRWHPVLGTPDPSDAWYAEPELAALRTSEAIDRAIDRRDRFEQAIAQLDNPTPQDIERLWHHIDEETDANPE